MMSIVSMSWPPSGAGGGDADSHFFVVGQVVPTIIAGRFVSGVVVDGSSGGASPRFAVAGTDSTALK
jgi:hypothetical protein